MSKPEDWRETANSIVCNLERRLAGLTINMDRDSTYWAILYLDCIASEVQQLKQLLMTEAINENQTEVL